jgi:hypothetical protein
VDVVDDLLCRDLAAHINGLTARLVIVPFAINTKSEQEKGIPAANSARAGLTDVVSGRWIGSASVLRAGAAQ